MNKPQTYEICIEGNLSDNWSDWFGELSIISKPNNGTILIGKLADQAALLGVLVKIHALNLTIISIKTI